MTTCPVPIMAAAGYGRILGVTSGSGWRAANAGAYACAKRAVASLTWQLGRHAPPAIKGLQNSFKKVIGRGSSSPKTPQR